MQYSLSNLNFFFILISAGYYLFYYQNQEKYNLNDIIASPIQLIIQFKGFFYKNYMLSLCFAITLFSFAGIPPLIGFFGKQLVLSAALEKGYFFMSLIAIITSVIGAVYYLGVIRLVFFYPNNDALKWQFDNVININEWNWDNNKAEWLKTSILEANNRILSTSLSLIISILTLIILLFIIKPSTCLGLSNTLAILLFNP